MLTIVVPGVESFNDETEQFVTTKDVVLSLEHSLVSLSKWESRFEKPFLTNDKKTSEETFGYIQEMSTEGEISLEVLHRLTNENIRAINDYIEAKMTATWFNDAKKQSSFRSDVITAEIIYHWLVALQIPFEAQYWHLNRLITLVKTINEKNAEASSNKKKAPTRADLDARRALMEERRRQAEANR